MLYYAIVFFVIALIAAFFGFSGIASGAAGIDELLFIGFLVLALVSVIGLAAGWQPTLTLTAQVDAAIERVLDAIRFMSCVCIAGSEL